LITLELFINYILHVLYVDVYRIFAINAFVSTHCVYYMLHKIRIIYVYHNINAYASLKY